MSAVVALSMAEVPKPSIGIEAPWAERVGVGEVIKRSAVARCLAIRCFLLNIKKSFELIFDEIVRSPPIKQLIHQEYVDGIEHNARTARGNEFRSYRKKSKADDFGWQSRKPSL